MPAFAGRDRAVDHDFVAQHQIGALFWKRDHNAHGVRCNLFD